jgi:hypothetical protein
VSCFVTSILRSPRRVNGHSQELDKIVLNVSEILNVAGVGINRTLEDSGIMQGDRGANLYSAKHPITLRRFKVLLVAVIIILTVQGWFGDFVNVFLSPAIGTTQPPFSLSGFLQTVQSLGFGLIWHAFQGMALVVLSIAALVLSFKWSSSRSVRISAVLGTVFVFAAAIGGFLFVLSGFSNGGNSMQMGGSFIAAYAFYFLALFYAKG